MIIEFLNEHLLPCSLKTMTGYECIGCGMQRAIIALVQGNIRHSFRLYPALIFQLSIILFTILHLIFKFKHGALVIKWLFVLTTVVIIISFLYKISNI